MKFLEAVISFLFPTTMILSRIHLQKYQRAESENFRTIMLYSLPTLCLVYVGHYHFFDIPMKLTPQELWLKYRYSMAALTLTVFLIYKYFRKIPYSVFKIPAVALLSLLCYMQTVTILWYPEVPYLYSFIFLIITSYALRLLPFTALLYVSVLFAIQIDIFLEANIEPALFYSAYSVAIFVSLVLSSIKYFQIKVFVTNENLLAEKQKNIEQNLDFMKTLKSFLPKKISNNLDIILSSNRMGIHQAVDEILSPRRKNISCLSCDIRGYTEKSKNIAYVADSVIPLTKTESVIVEDHDGIPRKIGDLLFCYFDDNNLLENIKNSLLSGVQIALHEERYNSTKSEGNKIRKQIIISIGEAYVGNIGGSSSAIEITALGTPVNFLNRLETVVKNKPFIDTIPRNHVIISNELFKVVTQIVPSFECNTYNLKKQNLRIKDFEEVLYFHSFEANQKNYELINNLSDIQFLSNDGVAI